MGQDWNEDGYALLRAMAHSLLHASTGVRPDATEVVHECLLRLRGRTLTLGLEPGSLGWRAYTARVLRTVLVDWMRHEHAGRRGGERMRITLSAALSVADQGAGPHDVDLVELDDALERLAVTLPTASHVVELRFFGGLDMEAIAAELGLTLRAVRSAWNLGRAWLARELGHGDPT